MATHHVSKGNSLRGLAKLYYDDEGAAEALARANQLREGERPKPGSTLRLPQRLVYMDKVAARQEMSTVAVMAVAELRSDLLFVTVQEERCQAERNAVVAIAAKWLYVVCDGAIVVRAQMPVDGEWTIENRIFEEQSYASDETLILLSGREYRYLLSPYELHPDAERRFAQRADKFWSAEHRRGNAGPNQWTVLVRDAYQWAHDTHEQLYEPRLDAYRSWVADEADRFFIASTLKVLVDAKDPSWFGDDTDPLFLEHHLKLGEPTNYLEQVYHKGLDERRIKAETAAARIATLMYSEEFQTLELSATKAGKTALKATLLTWATALEHIDETLPGRKLLNALAQDEERLAAKYLLTSSPPANILPFPQFRYLANAMIAILKDLAPAWLALNQARSARRNLIELADFISVAAGARVDVIEKSFEAMHDNLMQGVPLGTGVKYEQTTRLMLQATPGYNEAMKAAHTLEVPSTSLVDNVKLAESLSKSAKVIGLRGCLEVVNFANAYSDYKKELNGRKAMGVVGAAADLSALVVDVGVTLFKQLDKAAVRAVGASLGIVSGICDSVEFGLSSHDAASGHDYDAAVGAGIASAGAGLITVGSGLALYQTAIAGIASAESSAASGTLLSPRALAAIGLGRIGSFITLFGATLVGGGALWWHIAKDTSYQQFARHCFLGKSHGEGGLKQPDWTSASFPTGKTNEEARALVHLLSAFEVSLDLHPGYSMHKPYRLKIVPGFYGENDVFEICFRHEFMSERRSVAARLKLHVSSGEVRQQAGDLMAPIVQVVRGESGRVESIYISEDYADRSLYGGSQLASRAAWVKLKIGPKSMLPSAERWVGVRTSVVQDLHRPDATSSDPDNWIKNSDLPRLEATPQ